jgi:4-hydroxybenzoate polyprenyltransferase
MSTLSLNSGFNALLALCRASNLPTVWMNVLSSAVLTNMAANPKFGVAPSSAALALLLAFAMSCFYCGGMALNDLYDRAHDSVHQPYRPIPAGRITLARARAVTFGLFAGGLVCLLAAPRREGLIAGLLLVFVIWVYDRFHKGHPSTVFVMACARLLVYVVTAVALSGAVSGMVWFVAVLQAAYVLLLTVVARLESRASAGRHGWPVIPSMLAAMPALDGIALAIVVHPAWLLAGIACTIMTRAGQRYVRGD